jgi:hypothetical protein
MKITMETEMVFSENGLRIVAFSETEYSGAVIEVEKQFLKGLTGQTIIGIDTKQFSNCVSLLEEDAVELWLENLSRLHLIESKQTLFVDLVDVQRKRQFDTTKTTYPAHFEIDSSELKKIMKSAGKFEMAYAKIEFDGENSLFKISLDKRIIGLQKQLAVNKSSGAKGASMFLVGALGEILTGADGAIKVEIGDGMAIMFSYPIGNAKIVGVVAPRVEESG